MATILDRLDSECFPHCRVQCCSMEHQQEGFDPRKCSREWVAVPHQVFWGPHPAKHLKVLGEKMKQEGVETMAENNQMHRPGQEAERCQLMISFPSYTELAARNPEQSKGKEKEQPPGNQLTNSNQRRRARWWYSGEHSCLPKEKSDSLQSYPAQPSPGNNECH
ncbi:uncharacterized protein LOC119869321 isoform X1 [Canis lupus familiaris]|nr:uncharacterized protein LOC119869321 isoform X1 [Canis lupus familiaris]